MLKNKSVETIAAPQFINIQPYNPLISQCEIKVLYVGENRNGSYITEEVAKNMANSLPGTPMVAAFIEEKNDFGDHGEVITIEDGEIKFSCKTQPYGFVAPDAKVWFKNFTDIDRFGNEIERKYLIEYPDIKWLESNPSCRRIEIIQTYLNSAAGEEVRVRQRGVNGNYIYFQTIKRKVSDVKRVEIERRLSQAEYLKLLMEADTTKRQIRKTRYCLTYENQYFEIDVYPFWDDRAIAEIELNDENAKIVFPKQIKVIKEVTDDDSYKNASLAKI